MGQLPGDRALQKPCLEIQEKCSINCFEMGSLKKYNHHPQDWENGEIVGE
jgi:hypothetical protein